MQRFGAQEVSSSYKAFIKEFQAIVDHPDHGQSSTQRLLCLHQSSSSVADYLIRFCILAAVSGWNEPALMPLFRKGLNSEIQLELSCKDAGLDLDSCISLAIRLNQHFLHHPQSRCAVETPC